MKISLKFTLDMPPGRKMNIRRRLKHELPRIEFVGLILACDWNVGF